jgi:hypothetical protein
VLEAAWEACSKGPQPSLLMLDLGAVLGLQPSPEPEHGLQFSGGAGAYGGKVGPNGGVGVALTGLSRRNVMGALPQDNPQLQWLMAHRETAETCGDGLKGPRLMLLLEDEFVVAWVKHTHIFAH